MRIEWAELRQIRLPLLTPFTTSFGTETDHPCIIVSLGAAGVKGIGECVAGEAPWYSYETVETCWHIMRDYLVPRLLAADINEPSEVWDLFEPIRGHNMAKAGLEMASWDLCARARGVALSEMLGGTRARVPVGVSVGIQESQEGLVRAVDHFLSQGYRRIKLKMAPGKDRTYVKAVREAFPDILLQVDANSAYALDALPVFLAMDALNLLLIEQPLAHDDIVDHGVLQRALTTPICLDESIHSPDDARHAYDLGACRTINIKPGRVGGHRRSREIHDLSRRRGFPVWCGGMLETNIGRAHNIALASLPGFTLPGDISGSARYYARDVAAPNFVLNEEDSTVSVPPGPGIGVEPDRDALDAVTERVEVFEARAGASVV